MIQWIRSLFGSSPKEEEKCPVVVAHKPWSDADKALIMESHMPVDKLADILDRTPNAIRSKRKRLKAANAQSV